MGLAFLLVLSSAGCISSGQQSVDDRPSAVCTNGVFVGTYEEETGVVTFKGIPFAKQPVGDLRWKAPQPAEASDDVFLETYPDKDALLREFFSLQNYDNEAYADRYPGIWNYSEFITERSLRIPAVKTAEAHLSAGGTGKTYMYLFEKSVTLDKLRILGACHAIDLSYVFNNVKDNPKFGPVNKELASAVSSAWVNFATTGDPGYGWTEYNYDTRSTMIFGNDNTLKMVDDPKREQRELLMPYSEAGYI